MIIVLKKSNVILIGLIFALLIAIYSLNLGTGTTAVTTADEGQKTIILDPGHGGEDPGKVSGYSDLKEKDLNLIIAMKVKELLVKDHYNVLMTREDDRLQYSEGTTNIYDKRKQDLTKRKALMDDGGAAIVVSIHMNSFPETQYYGAQTFYPPNSDDSKKLAENLQNSLRESVDQQNKRQPQLKSDPIVILKDLKTPTTIVECGFLSNPEEEKRLGTEEYRDKLAKAITEGIKSYFK